MRQTLPEGITVLPAELDRAVAALDELEKDNSAPRQLSISLHLHVHEEYPKQVDTGKKDGDGNAIFATVKDESEEKALSKQTAPKPKGAPWGGMKAQK